MSVGLPFSRFFCLLLVMALCHLCLSDDTNLNLCMDDERQALLRFKHGLIDGAGRLASWVQNSDCCTWAGIGCDNITGHVHMIHLPGNPCDYFSDLYDLAYEKCYQEQKLRGDLSPSLLNLKQLQHLDLSQNDFEGKTIPRFMGFLVNLRYLNLSRSGFGGAIPPQLGNLSELRALDLSNIRDGYDINTHSLSWLLGLRFLRHLDMSVIDLSKASDWLQVINNLSSLIELRLSSCKIVHIHPHVASLNLTSLSFLDLSINFFNESLVPRWLFSLTGLVSLDLSACGFDELVPSSSEGFRNMTSLEFLHVRMNFFMNSSSVLKGFSSSNLISLDIRACRISSLVLDSLRNLTSLVTLDLSHNQLTKTIPKSIGNLCNLRDVDLSYNHFGNMSLTFLLQNFLECKSPSLESINIEHTESIGIVKPLGYETNRIVGTIPDSIGRLTFLKYLNLEGNLIYGQIPFSIGGLSSLERLFISDNRLNGSLPNSLGLLSNLKYLDISNNMLTGDVTDAHFANLNKLKYLKGSGNNLIFRPRLADWDPHFRLESLYLSSWDIGPQFPRWLLLQSSLRNLEISNTKISSTMPPSFSRLFPKLEHLDMSQNNLQGRLLGIPRTVSFFNLSHNQFSGQLPKFPDNSLAVLVDLSYNSFVGSLQHLICPYGGNQLYLLNLAINHLSGSIPNQCWESYSELAFLYLENNNLTGEIPGTLASLSALKSLNMCNNKLSGRLPASLKKLKKLAVLQLAGNKLVGRIPAWFGTELSTLRILNLRYNNFQGNITHELCYLTSIQILDLAHNNLTGNIPRCFNNFTVLSGKEAISYDIYSFMTNEEAIIFGSASLVIKGREDKYNTILWLVMIVDLSSNNFSGSIPSELMTLQALQSLNLSNNQLTGSIPNKIGDMNSLVALDLSRNQLSGELPVSLSSLSFLSSFNVSYNSFTGRVPTSTQLQSFNESSFFGNKLCGDPLKESCAVAVPNGDHEAEEKDGSQGADWDLIISAVSGLIAGFWVVVVPLIVSTSWRIAYFSFLRSRFKVYGL